MSPFSMFNLPMTIIMIMIAWAWFSLFSVILGSFF